MFGCHGGGLDFGGAHGISGLCGFNGPGWDGIDAIDVLGVGDHDHPIGENCHGPELSGVGVSKDGDSFGMRVVSHGDVSLFDTFSVAAKQAGLLRVASILVGQKMLDERSHRLLPVNACYGAKEGPMPKGYEDGMTGSTVMWRHYFQIPKREWGFLSTPEYDKEAGVYLDIAGMTWRYRDVGDEESQLVIKVVPLKTLNAQTRCWGLRKGSVDAHRKVAGSVNQAVFAQVSRYSPCSKAAEKRRAMRGEVTVAATAPVVSRRTETREASGAGVDLLSALRRSPQFAAMHTFAAGYIPALSTDSPEAADTAAASEMVAVKLALPRRRAQL